MNKEVHLVMNNAPKGHIHLKVEQQVVHHVKKGQVLLFLERKSVYHVVTMNIQRLKEPHLVFLVGR